MEQAFLNLRRAGRLGKARWLSSGIRWFIHLKERAMQLVRACAGWLFGRPVVADGEDIVHEMSAVLQQAGHPDAVVSALTDSVRRLTGARSVRWIRDPGQSPEPDTAERNLLLLAGRELRGALAIEPATADTAGWSPVTRRRLETLCTMAACALGRNDGRDWDSPAPDDDAARHVPDIHSDVAKNDAWDEAGRRVRELTAPVLQDATFLGAVLPFALSQAQRHGEPLSLLCVAIDRLHGIHELLGSEVAERAVRNLGTHLAAQLRSSDIVARIDDGRIIVVLPRARVQGALFVAQKICRSVETTPSLLAELPCLTVSVGVAECPASAQTVDALLEAADAGLALAKSQGRNRAAAAPAQVLATTKHLDRACLAG
jgi:diguanylate cyclase (GGDEF)-like protein